MILDDKIILLTLTWAITVTITLIIVVGILLKIKKKYDQESNYKKNETQELIKKLSLKQSKAYQAGIISTTGDYNQILGEFALLSKYDHIITLSTTSRQPSLDLIGVNKESIDFLEIKTKGSFLSNNEKHIKKLIDEKKVSYKIFDVELPNNFSINERILKNPVQKRSIQENKRTEKFLIQKKKAQEKYPSGYEPWKKSDDEFLANYWNDKSNTKNIHYKLQELSEKLGRSPGGIIKRLDRLGLSNY